MNPKPRRVGTLTAGLSLIAIGICFILYTLVPQLVSLEYLLRLWPVILISLGLELVLLKFDREDRPVKFDFAAVLLSLVCVGFGFCCEIARLLIVYYHLP